MSHLSPSSWHIMKFNSALLKEAHSFRQIQNIVNSFDHSTGRLLIVVGPDSPTASHLAGCKPFVDSLGPDLLPDEHLEAFRENVRTICHTVSSFHSDFERNTLLPQRLSSLLIDLLLNGHTEVECVLDWNTIKGSNAGELLTGIASESYTHRAGRHD